MFHGPAVVRGTPQEPRRSTADRVTNTLSLCEWLLGSRRLKQKRKLFPGPPPMDASWFPLPSSCTLVRPAQDRASHRAGVQAWLRNKYRIPFRHELPTSNYGKPPLSGTASRRASLATAAKTRLRPRACLAARVGVTPRTALQRASLAAAADISRKTRLRPRVSSFCLACLPETVSVCERASAPTVSRCL